MKRLIIFSILFSIFSFTIAQQIKREYAIRKTIAKPKIDGNLDDTCWQKANIASELLQLRPFEGKPATKNTEVKILYDDNALYISAMMYDASPDSISKELSKRDDMNVNADALYIGFIPYNQLDAYVFGITAAGVQCDVRDSDPTFDAVWESAVKINKYGWAAEMRIPFSAIRFPSEQIQSWGFQFTRDIKRIGEYDQWALTPPSLSNSRLNWGKIIGLENINAPLRLSLTPFISGSYINYPVTSENNNSYINSYSYNLGADLKYGIDEKFTLDLTLLPDFNQVQSDNKVKNLGYNEITYNENRPFFKEGTELFNKNALFYSRRIGQMPSGYYQVQYQLNDGEYIRENPTKNRLLNAIKLSGRNNNGMGIGLFNAVTDNSYAVIEDSVGNRRKILTDPLTNYNILVFDQQIKNNSSVYLINTNVIRTKNYQKANVTGVGFTLNNKKNTYAIDGNMALSQKFTKDDSIPDTYSDLMGYRYFFGFRKSSGNLQYGLSHTFLNKTYDSRDLGYYVIGNKSIKRIYLNYNIYKPNKLFRNSYNTISFDYGTNPQNSNLIFSQVFLNFYFTLLDYSAFSIGANTSPLRAYDYFEPRIEGRYSRTFRYYYIFSDFNTDARKALALELHFEGGDFLEDFKGIGFGNQTGIRYRINDRMQVKYIFNYNNDSYNIGFANFRDNYEVIYGGRQLKTYINSLNISYLFSKDMNISLVARHYWNTGKYKKYFLLLENGELSEINDYTSNCDFNYNVFNIDLIYTWQFAPGSTLSVVYKNSIESESDIINPSFKNNFDQTLNLPAENSVSIKLLYYLDYQNIKNSKV